MVAETIYDKTFAIFTLQDAAGLFKKFITL